MNFAKDNNKCQLQQSLDLIRLFLLSINVYKQKCNVYNIRFSRITHIGIFPSLQHTYTYNMHSDFLIICTASQQNDIKNGEILGVYANYINH